MRSPSKSRHRALLAPGRGRGLARGAALLGALTLAAAPIARAGAIDASAATAAAAAPAPTAPSSEAIGTLEALARNQAIAQLAPLGEHQRLAVGPLDARFAPEPCSGPIEPVVAPGGHPRDRVTVELRCAVPRWHLYVPVRVVGTSSVLLAAHAIVAGTVLGEDDFRTEQRDVQQLPPGYMDEPRAALGLSASRPIASGAVITNQMLIGTRVVQRGQAVTLVADGGGLSVRMAGRALSDGLVNQRVRVQNLSSGKVVEGIARSDQVVEIISR